MTTKTKTKKNETINKEPNYHKPEDLLEAADLLLQYDKQILYRAVVLESFAALEVYLKQIIVDKELKKILQPIGLFDWIEKQSRGALGNRLKITSELLNEKIRHEKIKWDNLIKLINQDYEYRHSVIHGGAIVEKEDAEKIYNDVYEFLSFLGLYTEIDSALKELKRYIENTPTIKIQDENDVIKLVKSYCYTQFGSLNDTYNIRSSNIKNVTISFGKNEVFLDMAFIEYTPNNNYDIEDTIGAINQLFFKNYENLFKKPLDKIVRGVMLVFTKNPIPDKYREIKYYHGGKIALMVIKTH
jgi:hypothetical protein